MFVSGFFSITYWAAITLTNSYMSWFLNIITLTISYFHVVEHVREQLVLPLQNSRPSETAVAIYLFISGKKLAFWQLVAVDMGQKTMQSGKKRRKITKINPKSKEKFALSERIIFWLPSFFPGMLSIYIFNILRIYLHFYVFMFHLSIYLFNHLCHMYICMYVSIYLSICSAHSLTLDFDPTC